MLKARNLTCGHCGRLAMSANVDDVIMTLYTNREITSVDSTIFKISDKKIEDEKLIYEIIK